MKKFTALVCLVLFAGMSVSANAQSKQKQKKQKNQPETADVVSLSVSDQIDHDIGEMLGAWQVGDVEAMHKFYADNATWVSGAYGPPIVGWQNYVQQYTAERNGFTGIQLIRKNTNVFHFENTAWVCYQWEFEGLSGGKTVAAHGQTTLVFIKMGDRWLIVHNHTSEIYP
jgi:ketosteroid isomerase-like protein